MFLEYLLRKKKIYRLAVENNILFYTFKKHLLKKAFVSIFLGGV